MYLEQLDGPVCLALNECPGFSEAGMDALVYRLGGGCQGYKNV